MVRILHQDPAFAKLVISYLLSRIGRIEEDFVDQFFNSSEKRLARILLLLARFGKHSEPKSAVLKLSQETLAEMVGTTRSRVRLLHEPVPQAGIHPLQWRLAGAPGTVHLRYSEVSEN